MLYQIVLMPLFCLEEVSEGLQFYGKRLPQPGGDPLERCLKHGQVGRIRIVDAGTVTGAFVVPLTVQAQRVDNTEI